MSGAIAGGVIGSFHLSAPDHACTTSASKASSSARLGSLRGAAAGSCGTSLPWGHRQQWRDAPVGVLAHVRGRCEAWPSGLVWRRARGR